MNEKMSVRIGTGAALLSIAILAYATSRVQVGPAWESPSAGLTNLLWSIIASFILNAAAVVSYCRGNQFRSQSRALRWLFWFTLSLSTALSVCLSIFEPDQWPMSHPTLATSARMLMIPIIVACCMLLLISIIVSRNECHTTRNPVIRKEEI